MYLRLWPTSVNTEMDEGNSVRDAGIHVCLETITKPTVLRMKTSVCMPHRAQSTLVFIVALLFLTASSWQARWVAPLEL